eukprot:COSAG01_NODE_48002_length_385_cov_0.608392_1_plen_50_part_01
MRIGCRQAWLHRRHPNPNRQAASQRVQTVLTADRGVAAELGGELASSGAS